MELGFLENTKTENFTNLTYRELLAKMIGVESTENIEHDVAKYLNIYNNADIIHRLKWLGLFDDRQITFDKGANVDVIVELMLQKMSYAPHEKDMIVIHDEVMAEFPDRKERRFSTMRVLYFFFTHTTNFDILFHLIIFSIPSNTLKTSFFIVIHKLLSLNDKSSFFKNDFLP